MEDITKRCLKTIKKLSNPNLSICLRAAQNLLFKLQGDLITVDDILHTKDCYVHIIDGVGRLTDFVIRGTEEVKVEELMLFQATLFSLLSELLDRDLGAKQRFIEGGIVRKLREVEVELDRAGVGESGKLQELLERLFTSSQLLLEESTKEQGREEEEEEEKGDEILELRKSRVDMKDSEEVGIPFSVYSAGGGGVSGDVIVMGFYPLSFFQLCSKTNHIPSSSPPHIHSQHIRTKFVPGLSEDEEAFSDLEREIYDLEVKMRFRRDEPTSILGHLSKFRSDLLPRLNPSILLNYPNLIQTLSFVPPPSSSESHSSSILLDSQRTLSTKARKEKRKREVVTSQTIQLWIEWINYHEEELIWLSTTQHSSSDDDDDDEEELKGLQQWSVSGFASFLCLLSFHILSSHQIPINHFNEGTIDNDPQILDISTLSIYYPLPFLCLEMIHKLIPFISHPLHLSFLLHTHFPPILTSLLPTFSAQLSFFQTNLSSSPSTTNNEGITSEDSGGETSATWIGGGWTSCVIEVIKSFILHVYSLHPSSLLHPQDESHIPLPKSSSLNEEKEEKEEDGKTPSPPPQNPIIKEFLISWTFSSIDSPPPFSHLLNMPSDLLEKLRLISRSYHLFEEDEEEEEGGEVFSVDPKVVWEAVKVMGWGEEDDKRCLERIEFILSHIQGNSLLQDPSSLYYEDWEGEVICSLWEDEERRSIINSMILSHPPTVERMIPLLTPLMISHNSGTEEASFDIPPLSNSSSYDPFPALLEPVSTSSALLTQPSKSYSKDEELDGDPKFWSCMSILLFHNLQEVRLRTCHALSLHLLIPLAPLRSDPLSLLPPDDEYDAADERPIPYANDLEVGQEVKNIIDKSSMNNNGKETKYDDYHNGEEEDKRGGGDFLLDNEEIKDLMIKLLDLMVNMKSLQQQAEGDVDRMDEVERMNEEEIQDILVHLINCFTLNSSNLYSISQFNLLSLISLCLSQILTSSFSAILLTLVHTIVKGRADIRYEILKRCDSTYTTFQDSLTKSSSLSISSDLTEMLDISPLFSLFLSPTYQPTLSSETSSFPPPSILCCSLIYMIFFASKISIPHSFPSTCSFLLTPITPPTSQFSYPSFATPPSNLLFDPTFSSFLIIPHHMLISCPPPLAIIPHLISTTKNNLTLPLFSMEINLPSLPQTSPPPSMSLSFLSTLTIDSATIYLLLPSIQLRESGNKRDQYVSGFRGIMSEEDEGHLPIINLCSTHVIISKILCSSADLNIVLLKFPRMIFSAPPASSFDFLLIANLVQFLNHIHFGYLSTSRHQTIEYQEIVGGMESIFIPLLIQLVEDENRKGSPSQSLSNYITQSLIQPTLSLYSKMILFENVSSSSSLHQRSRIGDQNSSLTNSDSIQALVQIVCDFDSFTPLSQYILHHLLQSFSMIIEESEFDCLDWLITLFEETQLIEFVTSQYFILPTSSSFSMINIHFLICLAKVSFRSEINDRISQHVLEACGEYLVEYLSIFLSSDIIIGSSISHHPKMVDVDFIFVYHILNLLTSSNPTQFLFDWMESNLLPLLNNLSINDIHSATLSFPPLKLLLISSCECLTFHFHDGSTDQITTSYLHISIPIIKSLISNQTSFVDQFSERSPSQYLSNIHIFEEEILNRSINNLIWVILRSDYQEISPILLSYRIFHPLLHLMSKHHFVSNSMVLSPILTCFFLVCSDKRSVKIEEEGIEDGKTDHQDHFFNIPLLPSTQNQRSPLLNHFIIKDSTIEEFDSWFEERNESTSLLSQISSSTPFLMLLTTILEQSSSSECYDHFWISGCLIKFIYKDHIRLFSNTILDSIFNSISNSLINFPMSTTHYKLTSNLLDLTLSSHFDMNSRDGGIILSSSFISLSANLVSLLSKLDSRNRYIISLLFLPFSRILNHSASIQHLIQEFSPNFMHHIISQLIIHASEISDMLDGNKLLDFTKKAEEFAQFLTFVSSLLKDCPDHQQVAIDQNIMEAIKIFIYPSECDTSDQSRGFLNLYQEVRIATIDVITSLSVSNPQISSSLIAFLSKYSNITDDDTNNKQPFYRSMKRAKLDNLRRWGGIEEELELHSNAISYLIHLALPLSLLSHDSSDCDGTFNSMESSLNIQFTCLNDKHSPSSVHEKKILNELLPQPSTKMRELKITILSCLISLSESNPGNWTRVLTTKKLLSRVCKTIRFLIPFNVEVSDHHTLLTEDKDEDQQYITTLTTYLFHLLRSFVFHIPLTSIVKNQSFIEMMLDIEALLPFSSPPHPLSHQISSSFLDLVYEILITQNDQEESQSANILLSEFQFVLQFILFPLKHHLESDDADAADIKDKSLEILKVFLISSFSSNLQDEVIPQITDLIN